MLHRDNREIVSTCDHLTIMGTRALAADWVSSAIAARPKSVLHHLCQCASGICRLCCCNRMRRRLFEKGWEGWAASGWCWGGLRIVEKCWRAQVLGMGLHVTDRAVPNECSSWNSWTNWTAMSDNHFAPSQA